jgi:hypothetical protein
MSRILWFRHIATILLSVGFILTAQFTRAFWVDVVHSSIERFLFIFYAPHYLISMLLVEHIINDRGKHQLLLDGFAFIFSLPVSFLYFEGALGLRFVFSSSYRARTRIHWKNAPWAGVITKCITAIIGATLLIIIVIIIGRDLLYIGS